jgi:hypothetical protein
LDIKEESLFTFATLLGFCQLICTALLKINHSVVAHLVAGTVLTQNPAGKFDAKFLDHFCFLVVIPKCNRKWHLLQNTGQNGGLFNMGLASAKIIQIH